MDYFQSAKLGIIKVHGLGAWYSIVYNTAVCGSNTVAVGRTDDSDYSQWLNMADREGLKYLYDEMILDLMTKKETPMLT